MYFGFLHTHNLLRYIILLLLLVTLFMLWKGFINKEEWHSKTDKWIKWLTITVDVQVVIGIVIYLFFSPIVESAFNDMASAMKDSLFRFYAVEHGFAMIIAVILIHLGKIKIGKAENSEKYKIGVIYITVAFVIILLAIPWPFYSFGKALI